MPLESIDSFAQGGVKVCKSGGGGGGRVHHHVETHFHGSIRCV